EDDHMDTLPSENTSKILVEPESLGPPPELIPVRRSERTKSAPNHLNLNIEVEDDVVGDLGEPANYKAAMLDPDKVIWQGAMDEEINSMKVNKFWIEVDPPPNAKIVRSKWLFKKKTNIDGKVHTYKARLVAKGSTQTYRIDYEETFSPATDIRAIRILIAIAAYYNYEIWQMDIKTAFLNASRSNGVFLILYIDDILIMGNNIPRLKEVKDYLRKCFSMKDLGEAAYILRIKIYRDRSKRLIGLSQSTYIDKILKKFNMHNSKKGSILYAVKCTRPDVAFAQNLVSRYQQNPGQLHRVAV
ncbi:retrotransposon protein, putative, ty1-copia subclass, partial [Tanacetum coccineum]